MTDKLHIRSLKTDRKETIALHNITTVDWGFNFTVDTELEAYKAAYQYRNNPKGVKVEYAQGVGAYLVTVFK